MSHYIESEAYAAAPSLLNAGLNERQLFTEDPTDLTDGLRSLDGDATTPSAEQDRAIANLCCIRDLVAADINDTTSHRPGTWRILSIHGRARQIAELAMDIR